MPNYDEATGIHYGAIHQSSLYNCAEDFHLKAVDETFEQHKAEVKGALRSALEDVVHSHRLDQAVQDAFDSVEQEICDHYEPQNPHLRYDEDGYVIESCLDFDLIVIKSPFYTFARPCSPCVPNAGDLNTPSETGLKTYCLGHDWFDDEKAPYQIWRVADDTEIVSKVEEVQCQNCKGTGRDTVKRIALARTLPEPRIVEDIKAGAIVVDDFNEPNADFLCFACRGKGALSQVVLEEQSA